MAEQHPLKHDFLCVGFAKCGTTTMHNVFKQHKDIYLPPIKETYMYFKKGYDWYMKRYYDKTTDKKFVGEFNPTFAMAVSHFSPQEIASRMHRDFGDIKIIFIVRNPVSKLYSWYRYALQYGWVYEKIKDNLVTDLSAGFEKYVFDQFECNEDLSSPVWTPGEHPRTYYVREGLYSQLISAFADEFPRENIKVIVFEDYVKDPDRTYDEILEFIGAEKDPDINTKVATNAGNEAPKSSASIFMMKAWKTVRNKYYLKVPFISYRFCERMMDLDEKITSSLTKPMTDKTPMTQRTKTLLENYYREDVRKLNEFTGRDMEEFWFGKK